MAEKSRRQFRFGRKFDGIDRGDSNFHLKKFSTPLGFENNVYKNFSARAAGTKFVGEIYCGATLSVLHAEKIITSGVLITIGTVQFGIEMKE